MKSAEIDFTEHLRLVTTAVWALGSSSLSSQTKKETLMGQGCRY